MNKFNLYENGELIARDLTSGQVSKEIGIFRKDVAKYAERGYTYKKRYTMELTEETIERLKEAGTDKITSEMLREWDELCMRLKKPLQRYGKTIHITCMAKDYAEKMKREKV